MAEEQSSLRQAIDTIMGWPAGGGQQGTGGTGAGASPSFGPTPAPSSPINLGTVSDIANTIAPATADPFEAQLTEIRAQNDALAASLAAPATTATTAAAPITIDETVMRDAMTAAGVRQQDIDQHVAAVFSQGATPTYTGEIASVTTSGTTPAMGGYKRSAAPVNPGSKAPWQQSQQYWRDLAAYTGK